MTHPFAAAPLDPDPFAGMNLDVPDKIRDRMIQRQKSLPLSTQHERTFEMAARSGEPRIIRKVALPNRRKSAAMRSVCHVVRQVASEMIDLIGGGRAATERDRRFTASHVQQISMYVCHVGLQLTMTDIARGFGRDRTTVGYACARVEDRRDDRAFDSLVSAVERVVATLFGPEGSSAHD